MRIVKYRIDRIIDRSADNDNEVVTEVKEVEDEIIIDETNSDLAQELLALLKRLFENQGYTIEP